MLTGPPPKFHGTRDILVTTTSSVAPLMADVLLSGMPHHYEPARCLRHASEQYRTLSQSRAHFLRHSNGRWQRSHIFGG